jgi:SAM-dependent methyltransferase
MQDPKAYFYPEVGARGFSRVDGTVEFYNRVNALIKSDSVVVDFGAGRGAALREDPARWRRVLRNLRGKCRRVIGIDVDDAVFLNPGLDEAIIIQPGGPIPMPEASVDFIVSDCVFEHISDPEAVCRELDRVLKPGGWLCAHPKSLGLYSAGIQTDPKGVALPDS